MKEEVIVSICCITYNQEKFIRQALDGFLMQKTNFKYELIIHDDASTDNTAKIIREYQKKYPEIIKTILQTENQYSKGIKIFDMLFKKSKGKYIALCEGDDYWCDENKLQKQVDYMTNNSNCSFCFHNANVYDEKTKKFKKMIPVRHEDKKFIKKDNVYNAGELSLIGFIPTASFMFKRDSLYNAPSFYYKASVGDLPIRLISSSKGYAYYFDDIMCVYRKNAGNSLCDQFTNSNAKKQIEDLNKIVWIIDEFDKYTDGIYHSNLDVFKKFYDIRIFDIQKNYKKMVDNNHKKYYKTLGIRYRFKIFIKRHFPFVFTIIKKIKNFLIRKKIIANWI